MEPGVGKKGMGDHMYHGVPICLGTGNKREALVPLEVEIRFLIHYYKSTKQFFPEQEIDTTAWL